MFENRTYRNHIQKETLVSYRVTVKETDLHVQTEKNRSKEVRNAVLACRDQIESYIRLHPLFATALSPIKLITPAPNIIHDMAKASALTKTGPMAAIAGAIAEYTARDILKQEKEVIIENGGDIFFKTDSSVTMGIYAGDSPLSMRIGIRFNPDSPLSVCTSSGTIGHSLSLGKADAVTVISESGSLADAAATGLGNMVKGPKQIEPAINYGKTIKGVRGMLIICGKKIGAWGDIELVGIDSHQIR